MDEELVDETIQLEVAEDSQRQSKEDDEYSPNRESRKTLKIQRVLYLLSKTTPNTTTEYDDILQGKNVVEAATSQHPRASLFMNDAGVTVEELTVKSYNGSSLDIGTSNNREQMYNRQKHWQNLYQLANNSGIGNSLSDIGQRNSGQATSSAWEGIGSTSFPELIARKSLSDGQSNAMEHLAGAESKEGAGDVHGGIRTKIISKSGFAEYFIKNTLKGKGIVCKGPSSNGFCVQSREKNHTKTGIDAAQNQMRTGIGTDQHQMKTDIGADQTKMKTGVGTQSNSNLSVNYGSKTAKFPSYSDAMPRSGRKRMSEQVIFPSLDMRSKKQKFNEDVRVTRSDLCLETANDSKVHISSIGLQDYQNEYEKDIQFSKYNIGRMSSIPHVSNAGQLSSTSLCERLENKWYASPEGGCTTSSNIYYCLGVLLFELLGHFDSERAHIAAMSDLHHRILPPVFLSENPKEAGFVLWLLHPEPSSRPTTREILQSEVINGLQELYKKKQNDTTTKLVEEIKCLESDIEEVERRHGFRKSLVSSGLQNDFSCQKEITPLKKEPSSVGTGILPSISPISNANELRLMRNISHLESAYFSMRSKVQLSETDAATHPDIDILRNRGNWYMAQKGEERPERRDILGTFFDGLCKYACYSKLEVRGVLRNADFNNPANVICSLSFDRDEDYFASAGISKKIKIFEFSALCNDSVDIHYPAVEMSNRSKLSCVCWNNYIKNYLASTDYDGVVKLWDASTGQEFSQFTEHERRAWSVDFSPVCPTKFASGSDDCTVKLWSISERNCLGTIRNVANVCCVQFSAHSSHLLAFGSADYSTYCYDLRNLRSPWCVLVGHRKAVSYVKFLDSETLVSASTDNTLKIWDLNKTSPVGGSAGACSLTLSGHTNEKNFVGLSVANGYIACGSETNEVYTYYRSLPMPITSHKFGSIDPISGKETDDDHGQFVSSVCWRGKSDTLIAANSSGCQFHQLVGRV
ncbi:WD40/YVTN repeat-like-containing domain superfamily [Sesbania bispinosa]|nr:WD40/YVTN repeat-like-containing domain superfamily [Sesbania bispinosa]